MIKGRVNLCPDVLRLIFVKVNADSLKRCVGLGKDETAVEEKQPSKLLSVCHVSISSSRKSWKHQFLISRRLFTSNSIIARLFSSFFAAIVNNMCQAPVLGTEYSKSYGSRLIGRRS